MMNNTPFLWQVARHYTGVEGLEDYCFVFPNRRGGQFFAHYLQQLLVGAEKEHRPHLMPRVTSINDLVAELTGTVAASDIEMMFALYDAYCRAMGDAAQEFDKFIYWAHLIIGDFNDIDKSLADADDIYRNLSDLHGLSSNYLSEEVQEKVRKLFGESLFSAFFDSAADADLWQRREGREESADGDDRVKREFMSLWNRLAQIYHLYHDELAKREVVSPGMQLRLAATGPIKPLRNSRLVLVGFGVLSAAEVKLFDHFKQEDKADYWWDNAGVKALLDKAPHDPGALLIDGYCKRFGAMAIEQAGDADPSIRVVAVPSGVGQAKIAFDELALMRGTDTSGPLGIDTAIVLPDEGLLVPLLHSVHGVERLNVTLGYPLRASGIVSLMHVVARMHNRASKEAEAQTYYREDVYDILSHPLIKTHFTHEAVDITAQLMRTNRFRIPASELVTLSFGALFEPAMDSLLPGDDRQRQADYLNQLLGFCELLMDKMQPVDEETDDTTSESQVELPLQQAFLVMYIDVLHQLKRSLEQCGQTLQRGSLFFLIDRLTSSAVVPFTGEPLQGVQVMGLLETRNLDFNNLVVLSMNERVFPRRRSINSFIPNYIRRAHGMSTIEQQEAIVAFNFYRLLNRAVHVTLVYDSSTQATGSSEPSRYIAQLEKIYGRQLNHVEFNPVIQTSSPIGIQAPNTGDSLRAVYTRDPQQGGKCLSASAINKFINCPLSFYLHYVQGLNDDNETSDFMDYGTFGTIVHDTLGDCYDCEALHALGRIVNADYIDWYRKNRLDAVIERNIKRTYLHVPEGQLKNDTNPLKGEAWMLVDTIKSYVNFVLDYDKELIASTGPFTVLECEQTHVLPAMSVGGEVFNFTYKPDRIDCLHDGTVRIVDYKTGGDKTDFDGMNDLFGPDAEDSRRPAKRCKAVLQLFLYCYAYLSEYGMDKKVMPVIYKLSAMQESGVIRKGHGQYVFSVDDEVARMFVSRMGETVRALYGQDFIQAEEDDKACSYCRFIDFCRRTPRKND